MQEPSQIKERIIVISNLVVAWRKEENEVVHFAADHDFGYVNKTLGEEQ